MNGANVSGISNLVSAADNVANTGTLYGSTNTAALWKFCPEGKCTNAYQNQDKNDKATFVSKSKEDQCFYTDESNKNVYTLLNDQKEAKKYSLFWDTKLVLDFSGTKPSGKCKSGAPHAVPLVSFLIFCDVFADALSSPSTPTTMNEVTIKEFDGQERNETCLLFSVASL